MCAVRISSQSFALVGEYEMDTIGGNFREATGIDSDVAFLVREPEKETELKPSFHWWTENIP